MADTTARDEVRGGSKLVVLLQEVTPADVEQIAELVGDVLHDLRPTDGDYPRGVIAAFGYEWPEDIATLVDAGGEFDGANMIVIPGDVEEDEPDALS